MHSRKALVIGFVIAGLSALAAPAMAQGQGRGQAPAAPFMTHQLKPNVYWIEGGGGNSGVIVGDKGVIVIDAKTTAAGGKELLDNIARITPKPVTAVILTHSDLDHVNGLASFPAGVRVIAQENNKKEQETALAAGGRGAPPADHLPSQVISKNKESLKIEGVKFEFHHWAPAHTSGDLVIYMPGEKIVFTGDIIAGGVKADPLIHLGEERLVRRVDHHCEGNCRPQRRSVRRRSRRCPRKGRYSEASGRCGSQAGEDQGSGRTGQVSRRDQNRCRRSAAGAGWCRPRTGIPQFHSSRVPGADEEGRLTVTALKGFPSRDQRERVLELWWGRFL